MNQNKTKKPNENAIVENSFTHNHRGITLVALIITIIIMLILAGVSIGIAINGGLFDITKEAARETEEAKKLEQQLAEGRLEVEGTWYDSLEDYLEGKPSENQGEGGENPPVDTSVYENAPKDANGLLLANAAYTSDGKIAVVPKGFKIINGIEKTQSIADGLVIQDKDENEFVWIPVKVTESDTETSIASFYRSNWKDNARSTSLTDSTTYTEPYASGYAKEAEEYAEMVKSVYKNKGFYVGRYEAGSITQRTDKANRTTTMVVKKNQYPYNYVGWGTSMSDYTSDVTYSSKDQGKGAVYLSKNMYQGKDVGVISTLCYGVQWDAMLDFIKDQKDVTDSTLWGNYSLNGETIEPKLTGSVPNCIAKNIYDVAGNLWEYTMESYSSGEARAIRSGGINAKSRAHPGVRDNRTTNICTNQSGFRVTLYIK